MHCAHNVRVLVEETQETLQTPEEALQAAEDPTGDRIVVRFQFGADVLENHADYPANGQNQRAESHCAQMVSAKR